MFKVIYEWRVPAANFTAFNAAWEQATDSIHHEVKGALGSMMIQSSTNQEKVLTIAKWVSQQDWEHFWYESNSQHMQTLHALAKRISFEGFNEIDDRTRNR